MPFLRIGWLDVNFHPQEQTPQAVTISPSTWVVNITHVVLLKRVMATVMIDWLLCLL